MLQFCPNMSKSLEKSLFWPIKPCISPLSRKMHTLKMLFFPVFYLKYFGTFFLLIRHIAPQKEGHIYSTKFTTQQQKTRSGSHSLGWVNFFRFLPNSCYRCIIQFWKFDPPYSRNLSSLFHAGWHWQRHYIHIDLYPRSLRVQALWKIYSSESDILINILSFLCLRCLMR